MELPIYLAMDTTENWNRSTAALGASELAIELHTDAGGSTRKYLLVGDGQIVGPNVERLRAGPDFIAGLEEKTAQQVKLCLNEWGGFGDSIKTAIDEHNQSNEAHLNEWGGFGDSIKTAIDEHNQSNEAHPDKAPIESPRFTGIPKMPDKTGVPSADGTLFASEAQVHETADQINGELDSLQRDFNAWIGRGGYLNAFDFGTESPSQEDLTEQALLQIPSIDDPLQIWNGTKIINLFNNYLWILTNTQDTDPAMFEWSSQGNSSVAPFASGFGGYIVGADPAADGPEYVFAQQDGKGKIAFGVIKQILFEMEHPVGDVVEQMPGALSPIDKHWPGVWEIWNDRASEYRLRQTPIPNYTVYTAGTNYAANAVVMWHLEGDDYAFFKAKANVSGAGAQLDPLKWDQLKEGTVIERKNMLDVNPWTDNDFVIGQQITGGEFDGYYVEEIIVYGGKFPSFAGGNRPPFVDGTAGDVQRNISCCGGLVTGDRFMSEPFYTSSTNPPGYVQTVSANSNGSSLVSPLYLDIFRVVPTGAENSPRTLSKLIWRRVA